MWYKKAEYYQKMLDWFKKRTNKHIDLVQKYCKKIEEYNPVKFKGLMERSKKHDQTKFKDPEIYPYVYTTWKYKCKDDGEDFVCPEGIDGKMDQATIHHILNESHHPEKWCGRKTNLLNTKDRDKPPSKIVDATKMPDLDVCEMVADWCAVSEERGNSPKTWADKNINVRWKFSDKQKNLIYELIDEIWG